jgi:hypothetical protein
MTLSPFYVYDSSHHQLITSKKNRSEGIPSDLLQKFV